MLKIYNSLTRKIEEFEPINPPNVSMYACGPTVYDFAHIGNFRTYITADLLLRTLEYNGYKVKYVMNITDVGHLTGDNLGDADTGEDKIEKTAQKTGRSAWDIAKFYTEAFLKDFDRLNLEKPFIFAKATDHIKEQTDFIKKLEKKGYVYKTSDGLYFNTSKFPEYGKLSALDQIKEGARVEINPEKRNPKDFALWKFSPKGQKRQMEWNSPWGIGFPGWHIECSAMSMKYLGESFDVHAGGVDLREIHHPNEIAQSEAATGQQFVKYWVHGAFILVDGERMSKSLGNNFNVQDLVAKGFDPLSLRYLYLQTHYRQEMNFTWDAFIGAEKTLKELWDKARVFGKNPNMKSEDREPSKKIVKSWEEFDDAVNNDLDIPSALAILHEGLKQVEDDFDLLFLLEKTDQVFGLNFKEKGKKLWEENQRLNVKKTNLSKKEKEILDLVKKREILRKQKKFHLADQIRIKIKKLGFEIEDEEKGKVEIKRI